MIPQNWSALLDRFAAILGDRSAEARAEAEDWVRCAVHARYRVESLHDLDRVGRQLAFQKSAGALLALEEEGVPQTLKAESGQAWLLYRDGSLEPAVGQPTRRERVAAAFARYFDGVEVEGPPWRVSPEEERPTYDEWVDSADFARNAAGTVA